MNHHQKRHITSQAGVTLIELIIVIGIVGILSAGLISVINPVKQLQKARDTQRKADISVIQTALELYRADSDGYPSTGTVICGSVLQSEDDEIIYLQKIPCDAKDKITNYDYESTTSSSYKIIACLENVDDKDKDGSADYGNSSCSTPASYTRTNP